MDIFENQNQEIHQPPAVQDEFPNFNTRWMPDFDEGIKTKIGSNLEKGSDILKKSTNLYWISLGLTALVIILPAILRFIYELSRWAYNGAGSIFPK